MIQVADRTAQRYGRHGIAKYERMKHYPRKQLIGSMTREEIVRLARDVAETATARLGRNGSAPSPVEPRCGVCSTSVSEGRVAGPASEAGVGGADWVAPKEGIARLIDHTLLAPDAADADVVRLCREARQYGFWSVCVHPCRVGLAVRELAGADAKVCTVIGFPHGANTVPVKRVEAEQALKLGADELDMVVNVGALRSGRLDSVYAEIRSLAGLTRQAGAKLKVILEMACLDEAQKIQGAVLARLAGADFVKTSTGFGPGGAKPEDVALLHRLVGGEMGIKAAGGIRTYARLEEMMGAGATRIGASAGVEILEQVGGAG